MKDKISTSKQTHGAVATAFWTYRVKTLGCHALRAVNLHDDVFWSHVCLLFCCTLPTTDGTEQWFSSVLHAVWLNIHRRKRTGRLSWLQWFCNHWIDVNTICLPFYADMCLFQIQLPAISQCSALAQLSPSNISTLLKICSLPPST